VLLAVLVVDSFDLIAIICLVVFGFFILYGLSGDGVLIFFRDCFGYYVLMCCVDLGSLDRWEGFGWSDC